MTRTPTSGRSHPPPHNPPRQESYKETLESVVVAFILAFVFRAFVIEAFVIPTGSMAATLNGEHWTHVCSDCGYQFAIGANRTGEGKLDNESEILCPNCSWAGDRIEARSRTDNGDRILVFKWPLDFVPLARTLLAPSRWDVTVFKDPADGTTNFIKRLVGLPGEVLEIVDGDIYTAPLDTLPDSIIQQLHKLRELKERFSRRPKTGRPNPHDAQSYGDLARQLSTALTPFQTIQCKPPEAQSALQFVVYDADHASRRAQSGTRHEPAPQWRPDPGANAWSTEPPTFRFDGLDSDRQPLRLHNVRPGDFYGYNTALKSSPSAGEAPVSDLRLQVVFTPEQWSTDPQRSSFELVLTKSNDEFRARFEPDGLVSLIHLQDSDHDAPKVLCSTQSPPLRAGQARRLAMANFDYRVSVSVDDRVVLSTTDEMYAPDLARLKDLELDPHNRRAPEAAAAIAAAHVRARVAHVLVERDVYYRNVNFSEGHDQNVWYLKRGWGTQGNPILLGPDEYFVLGDNSPQSKDSRLWWEVGPHLETRPGYQLGTVPADQIVGRAFFVYWPGGYRAWWTLGRAIIPNVGRMRWIQ